MSRRDGRTRVIQFSIEQLTGSISGVIKRFDPRAGHCHVTPSPEPKESMEKLGLMPPGALP